MENYASSIAPFDSISSATCSNSSDSEDRDSIKSPIAFVGFPIKRRNWSSKRETFTKSETLPDDLSSSTCRKSILAEFQLTTDRQRSTFNQVLVRLGDSEVIPCRIKRTNTLESLIDMLRRKGRLFRADNVTLQGFCLLNWKQESLEAIGLRGEDEIHMIEETPSRKVIVRIEATDQDTEIQVDRGKNCWKEIQKTLTPGRKDFHVMVQEGMFYRRNHRWQRAVADNLKDGPMYFGEENGEIIHDVKKPLLVVEFLKPWQGLRAAPRGIPHLLLYDAILGWENDHVVALNAAAPFDHKYIACLFGFQSRLREGPHLFLQVVDNYYVECLAGSKELTREKVLECHKNESVTPQAICLLLRENSLVPRWHNRSAKHFALYTRDGVELKVMKDHLFRASPTSFGEDTSCWILRHSPTPFDLDFNRDVMRWKKKND